MKSIRSAISLLPLTLILAACAPNANAGDKLAGRWESPTWKFGSRPLVAQLSTDGKVEYTSANANIGRHTGTWTLLESGELLIKSDTGREARCKIALSGKTLTFQTAACMDGWEGFAGESLTKQ
ncbi:hypothetical protein NIBR502774_18910 (plasmid) [Rhizobium sp. NIBRBAC000502774]|nr:hypothetical protein NIBR502774_18910 [Rhizobium sp. NIBRBAC000502774]